MTKGKVVFYNESKGWGFVEADETKESFFFYHKSLLYEPCRMNDKVNFNVEKSKVKPGKLCAVDVTIQE